MGMPGVGKGTQAAKLGARLGVPHLSTGDVLRQAIRGGSELGQRVRSTVESGALVSDDLMARILEEPLRAARDGFVLDGFPRTRAQAEILERLLDGLGFGLDAVFLLSAPEHEVVRRLAGRRVCPGCSAVYHLDHHPPARPGVCDACGVALAHRPDDHEDVILDRLRVYREQTLPAADFYRSRGLLHEIDASGDAPTVLGRLMRLVEAA